MAAVASSPGTDSQTTFEQLSNINIEKDGQQYFLPAVLCGSVHLELITSFFSSPTIQFL